LHDAAHIPSVLPFPTRRSSDLASPARTTIPFEKTSLSPRFANCRGKNRSRARRAASRGKPWNDVFAASTRIAKVDTWTTQNMNRSEEHTSELQSQSNLVCRLLL